MSQEKEVKQATPEEVDELFGPLDITEEPEVEKTKTKTEMEKQIDKIYGTL
jgi:hypothetical protein